VGRFPRRFCARLELADYVDKHVPALTYDTWKMRQVPQMKIVGSNFPLVSKTALLPAVSEGPAATIPAKPKHVLIAPAQVRQSASDTAPIVIQLTAGTQVRLKAEFSGILGGRWKSVWATGGAAKARRGRSIGLHPHDTGRPALVSYGCGLSSMGRPPRRLLIPSRMNDELFPSRVRDVG
jgi:hypothetical protein